MTGQLHFVAQRMLNQPLALHASRAPMIVAALRQRLQTRTFQMDGAEFDELQMEALAGAGRQEAGVRQARRSGNGKIFHTEGKIAVIPVEGTLANTWGLDPESGFTGYDGIENKLLSSEADPEIEAQAFVIDSGGGDVAGLFDLVDLISTLSARNGGKPKYAICADYAYSAAYAIASACDRIWLPRTGGVGSVGVIMLHAEQSVALSEEGITVTVIRSGKEKARANSFEPLPSHTLEHLQGQCDEARDIFVETVAANLGLPKKTVSETEAVDYMGRHAKAIGFAHEIGSKHAAWDDLLRRTTR